MNRQFIACLAGVACLHLCAGAGLLVLNHISRGGADLAEHAAYTGDKPVDTPPATPSGTPAGVPVTMPTPVPAPVAPVVSEGPRTHVVAPGESYWSIAKQYGVGINELMARNGHDRSHVLKSGEKLVLPGN